LNPRKKILFYKNEIGKTIISFLKDGSQSKKKNTLDQDLETLKSLSVDEYTFMKKWIDMIVSHAMRSTQEQHKQNIDLLLSSTADGEDLKDLNFYISSYRLF